MHEEINNIEVKAIAQIEQALSLEEIEALKVKYLGRKSSINKLFSRIPGLDKTARISFGRELNTLKEKLMIVFENRLKSFRKQERELDLTFPSSKIAYGRKHILSRVNEKICRIFEDMGFVVIEGKEIEDELHNFSALNIPLDHPSREAFDTFYLDMGAGAEGDSPESSKKGRLNNKYLLRSHTSPSQVRVMKKTKPPLAVISPGRVYRPDKVDASHSFMFHQIEGFCVDKGINFSHLKGVLLRFAKDFFSPEVRLRFRPHFFPFTEPSAEVDISCMICSGEGCRVCSYKGWLEILGCGMIHPKTMQACNINPRQYSGFAFGMGVERITMLKFGINDIRLFYENDTRFLNQFYEV